jgi:hypothetical protein
VHARTNRAAVVLVVLAAALAAGCARRARLPEPPPAPPPTDGGGLTVTLAWDAPVDLDLYVTEPGLETVYFANRRTGRGGVLARDARCADAAAGPRVEQAHWATPPPGTYRVAVDFLETCRGARAVDVAYRLAVDHDGRREEHVGRAHVGERDRGALEFTIGGDGG